MKFSAIAKGLLTFVLPSSFYCRSTGGTDSARYCYSVYLRHLVVLDGVGANTEPKTIAEIGPGDSIGIGLAALIAGAERYYGFDVKAYSSAPRNHAIFDELVELFHQHAPIPGEEEFPRVKPYLDSYNFPAEILTDERLERALAPKRLARLRAELAPSAAKGDDCRVSYIVPWDSPTVLRGESIDWIFSQAVLEHVDDLDGTYRACFNWLKPESFMSHQIDFKCHGTSDSWNGHWAYSDVAWRIVRGGRPYLLNRQPHSAHLAFLKDTGFTVPMDQTVQRCDGIDRSRLAKRFVGMSGEDLATAGTFIIAAKAARRPASSSAEPN